MRKLIVSMNVTLDGFMSGPDCELDWHFKSWTKEIGDALCKHLSQADTILLGRVTYTAMAKYWPSKIADPCCRGEDFAFANMMNSYTKIVFSKTITSTQWNNSKLINGNLQDEINALKAMPGKNIIVYGSGQLADALSKSGVVDEYQLWVHPVILGKGKPLFKPDNKRKENRLNFTLLSTERFTSGVILLHYQTIKYTKMKTINRKVSEEFSKGNFEFAFAHFAEDIQWNVVGACVIKGKEAVISHCKKMLDEMVGSTLTNTKHIVGEDSIAMEGYCDYSNDGKPGRVEYCDVYKFAGEKLQDITSYCIEIKQE